MPDANEGVVAVLSKLDEETVFTLAKTVTQGLKRSRTTEEAVQNIIKYSQDELSILRRKAVTREVLFQYLEENNVKVRLPITKNELIDAILDLWQLPRQSTRSVVQKNETEISSEVSINNDKSNVDVMAEQFAKWFYSMLNSHECGPEHFFSDAKFKLNMYVNDECETTEIEEDPEEIGKLLLSTKMRHNLYFNPNESKEGIQGRMDPHGLVMVLSCGTLHVQDICAGVFEQVFALARDPCSDNNWKIKSSELNLRSKSKVMGIPKLCDSELTSELLALPSE